MGGEKFVKESDNIKNPSVRGEYGKRASVIGILCNVLLFAGKMIVGMLAGSVSISADAVNNLSDASSGIISLFGFKLASRPADKEHPYGHGRYEYLAGLMVAVMIMVIGVELFRGSVVKIINPSPVQFSWIAMGVLVISILVKLWMMLFYKKAGKKINSKTLMAASADSRNDVITTAAVLASALASHYASVELDGWMGVAVALFILYSGFGLVKDTLDPMLGRAPDEELVKEIRSKILSYSGVLGTHDLMVHDYGPGRQFASVHVEMSAEQDVVVSHEVIDKIERDFHKSGLRMIVHFDPVTENGKEAEMRIWVCERLHELDGRITIHDFHLGKKSVRFDCLMPNGMEMSEEELRQWICGCVAGKYTGYKCEVTIDRSYAEVDK